MLARDGQRSCLPDRGPGRLPRHDRARTLRAPLLGLRGDHRAHRGALLEPGGPGLRRLHDPLPGGRDDRALLFVLESNTAVWDRLDEGQRIALTNESARWSVSNILHGEQGALSLSASLCDIFLDPGAQEYAANQVREEARHVHAFSRYVQARFDGRIFPVGDTVGRLLGELVATPVVYKKIVGMQMLVEGVAMGAFTTLYKIAQDPLLRRVCQLVMTDEAFHHKFGKIWAHATLPQLDEAEHQAVEDWALECFNTLLFNLVNPEQKRLIYPQFGLDWQWVRDAVMEARTDDHRRVLMQRSSNVFRTLVKTLLKAGIITDRTRASYAMWVNLDELAAEGDVLGTLGLGRAVLHPLAPPRDHRLSRPHVEHAARVADAEHPLQDDRVFVEFRRLPRLDPAGGAPHVGDAHGVRPGVHPTD